MPQVKKVSFVTTLSVNLLCTLIVLIKISFNFALSPFHTNHNTISHATHPKCQTIMAIYNANVVLLLSFTGESRS